jgi:hypothetical protein
MNNKKQIIEETYDKVKTLMESRLNENPAAQPAAPAQQQQQPAAAQQQQQPAADPQRDQKIAKNIEVTMDQAMAQVVKNLPNVLANFAKTAGDKDGALDAPGVYDNNDQQGQAKPVQEGMFKELTFDENKFMETMGEGDLNEGGIIGLAVSAPAIMQLGGKATKWVGKKMNNQWLQKWGGKVADVGDKMHHKYVGVIEKMIKPLMPNAKPEQLHKAANAVFMGVVAGMFVGSLAHPGMLTGVKAQELGKFSLDTIKSALPNLGFA